MNSYEMKQEARRERLEAAAERASAESNASYNAARKMASGIPFGQPILVGHHSERRDRNYRAKIENKFRASFEAQERAKELAAKAAAVGTGGISSDDPDAVAKLSKELAGLEKLQVAMRAANAAIRKHAKAGADAQIKALVEQGISEARAADLIKPDFCGRIGFADYQLSNNNANIRRIKGRIEHLDALAKRAEQVENIGPRDFGHGVAIEESDNRVCITFPGKPADAIRADLKGHGFKWSPTRGAWVRMTSNAALYHAERIAKLAAQEGAQ